MRSSLPSPFGQPKRPLSPENDPQTPKRAAEALIAADRALAQRCVNFGVLGPRAIANLLYGISLVRLGGTIHADRNPETLAISEKNGGAAFLNELSAKLLLPTTQTSLIEAAKLLAIVWVGNQQDHIESQSHQILPAAREKGETWLDLASGPGFRFGIPKLPTGTTVVAVDHSRFICELLASTARLFKKPLAVTCEPLETVSYPDQSLDGVRWKNVHSFAPGFAKDRFDQMLSWIKPGGRLLIQWNSFSVARRFEADSWSAQTEILNAQGWVPEEFVIGTTLPESSLDHRYLDYIVLRKPGLTPWKAPPELRLQELWEKVRSQPENGQPIRQIDPTVMNASRL